MRRHSTIALAAVLAAAATGAPPAAAAVTGALQVTKSIDWSGSPPDGSVFEICISGPTYPTTPSCVQLGGGQSATWLELVPGEYTVVETDPGGDWSVSGSGQVMVVSPGQTAHTTVQNTYQGPGTLQVTKTVVWSGSPPDGSAFEICITGPTYPTTPSCVQLDDGQSATWLELAPGDYTITETDPGPGWTVLGSGVVRTVQPGQTATHSVTNALTLSTTLRSRGGQDGWVRERHETSGTGGARNATSTVLRVGDDAGNRQYRTILSFDTAGIPDTAVITGVTLRLKRAGDPVGRVSFSAFRGLRVDIRVPWFGAGPQLRIRDFQARASSARVGRFSAQPSAGWYSATLSSAAFPFVNRNGLTQLRVRFARGDNNDFGADYLRLRSGNAAVARQPQLIVEYYAP